MSKSKRTFGVLGLGIFGSTVTKTLCEYDFEVLAADKDIECVERVANFCSSAVQCDMTNLEQLRHIGFGECDVVIVGTGSHLEDSILAVMNLKELGVKKIIAKAKNKQYMAILEKVGADRVVRPEKEMGERVAKSLLSNNIVDLVEVDDEYSIVDIHVPSSWVGQTLIGLNVRARFGINIIGIRKNHDAPLNLNVTPGYTFQENDQILVVAKTSEIEKLDVLNRLS